MPLDPNLVEEDQRFHVHMPNHPPQSELPKAPFGRLTGMLWTFGLRLVALDLGGAGEAARAA